MEDVVGMEDVVVSTVVSSLKITVQSRDSIELAFWCGAEYDFQRFVNVLSIIEPTLGRVEERATPRNGEIPSEDNTSYRQLLDELKLVFVNFRDLLASNSPTKRIKLRYESDQHTYRANLAREFKKYRQELDSLSTELAVSKHMLRYLNINGVYTPLSEASLVENLSRSFEMPLQELKNRFPWGSSNKITNMVRKPGFYRVISLILELVQLAFLLLKRMDKRVMGDSLCHLLLLIVSIICVLISVGEFVAEYKKTIPKWTKKGKWYSYWFYKDWGNGKRFGSVALYFTLSFSIMELGFHLIQLCFHKEIIQFNFVPLLFAVISAIASTCNGNGDQHNPDIPPQIVNLHHEE